MTTKKMKKKTGFWHICMRCGRTVNSVNKDGECKECVKEIKGFSTYADQVRMF
jgi:ribosomal protein L34E